MLMLYNNDNRMSLNRKDFVRKVFLGLKSKMGVYLEAIFVISEDFIHEHPSTFLPTPSSI